MYELEVENDCFGLSFPPKLTDFETLNVKALTYGMVAESTPLYPGLSCMILSSYILFV